MDTSLVRRAGVRPLSTVEEGARAIRNPATSPAVGGQTGLYFNGLHEAKAQTQAYDPDARRQLQELSLELTGLSAEGVAVLERLHCRAPDMCEVRVEKQKHDGYAPRWRPALTPPSWID
jgi:hypothetical protein